MRQIDVRDGGVVVGERRGAVGQPQREVGARPVEYRHEVVTQHRDAELPHAAHAAAEILDQPIAAAPAEFDVLVHGNAFDYGEAEPRVFDLPLEGPEPLAAPGIAHRQVV